MNYSQTELNKFSHDTHTWWDSKGLFKTLHQLNPIRFSFIKECSGNSQGKEYLDVGCGGGILTESLAGLGCTTAIDANEEAIKAAKTHAELSQLTIDYYVSLAENFAKQHPQAFDVITCMELLEHVPDPASVIAACSEMLRPGGYLFFSTINRTVNAYLQAIIGAEYLTKLLPLGTHDYQSFMKPSELHRAAREQGLTLKQLAGIHFNPFTKQFSKTSNVSVNYMACFTKGN